MTWADVGRPAQVGLHGESERRSTQVHRRTNQKGASAPQKHPIPKIGLFSSPDLRREQIGAVAKREGFGFRVVEILEEYDASGGDGAGGSGTRFSKWWNGANEGVILWNLARFSGSVKDALTALERIEVRATDRRAPTAGCSKVFSDIQRGEHDEQ